MGQKKKRQRGFCLLWMMMRLENVDRTLLEFVGKPRSGKAPIHTFYKNYFDSIDKANQHDNMCLSSYLLYRFVVGRCKPLYAVWYVTVQYGTVCTLCTDRMVCIASRTCTVQDVKHVRYVQYVQYVQCVRMYVCTYVPTHM